MVDLICSWIYLLLAGRKPQRLIEYRRLLYTLSVFMFVYWFRLLVDNRAQLTGLVANVYQHDVLRERPSRYWPNLSSWSSSLHMTFHRTSSMTISQLTTPSPWRTISADSRAAKVV